MTKADLVRGLAVQFPSSSDTQLARLVQRTYPLAFADEKQANWMVRYVRGHAGDRNRKKIKDKPVARKRKGACPVSLAEAWEPYDLGDTKAAVLCDLHVPYHDQRAIEVSVKTCKKRKPKVLIVNGDGIDFYSISRFERHPKKRDAVVEIEIFRDMMYYLRGEFPRIPIVYKLGNHDLRWYKLIWDKAPEISGLDSVEFPEVMHFPKLGVTCVDDNPIMVGKLAIFHGHELPNLNNPVGPARAAFLRCLDSVMIGHVHKTNVFSKPNMWHDETVCWSVACLCNMRPRFARLNDWNQGFAWVESYNGGQFDVTNYRIGKDYAVRTS